MSQTRFDKLFSHLELLQEELKCPICLDTLTEASSLPCNHQFCKGRECIKQCLKVKLQCPLCKVPCYARSISKNNNLVNIVLAYQGLRDSIENLYDEAKEGKSLNTLLNKKLSQSTEINNIHKNNNTNEEIKTSEETTPKTTSQEKLRNQKKMKIEEVKASLEINNKNNNDNNNNENKPKFTSKKFSPTKREREEEEGKENIQKHKKRSKEDEDVSSIAPKILISTSDSFVLLATGVPQELLKRLQRLCRSLGGSSVTAFNENVTHIVTQPNHRMIVGRTLKYLQGILNGGWIVSFDWIDQCLQHGCWVAEDKYEIQGDFQNGSSGPRRGRLQTTPLFEDMQFYLIGKFGTPGPSKVDIKSLCVLGGGTVLNSLPKSSKEKFFAIIDDETFNDQSILEDYCKYSKLTILRFGWLLDSAGSFRCFPYGEFLVDVNK